MISQRQLFLSHIAQTSPFPLALEIASAQGIYIQDVQGKRYLDLISGINVSTLGHAHPTVVEAVCQQAKNFMHLMVYGEYIMSPQVRLASLLVKNLPNSLDSVYFVNSGAEAVEGAMKLAKRHTGRSELVACRNAYHGSTQGAMSLMSAPDFTQAFRPLLPLIKFIDFNNIDSLEIITQQTAGVVVEVVQGEAGVQPAESAFLQALRKRCDETGCLLIFDEIQSGYGRTGKLFAFEHYGVIPDILLMAKGMGGGLPLGAFVANRGVMQCFTHEPILGHITTFGGNPVCCAASLATLEVLLENDQALVKEVAAKEKHFKERLSNGEGFIDFRSAGLMMALDLGSWERLQKTITYCLENGLIVDWFLFNNQSARLSPPLTISHEEIDHACDVLLVALQKAL